MLATLNMDGSVRTCAMTGVLKKKGCVWFQLKNKNTWMQSNKRKQTKFKCVIKFAKIDLEWIGLETTRTIWH